MLAHTTLKQVVGYVQESLKAELMEMKAENRRLSESELVEEALMIAMPTLRERHLSFKQPARGAHGRKRTA